MLSLKKTLSLLLLSSLFISTIAHDAYTCDHDKIVQHPGLLEIKEDMSSLHRKGHRVLQDSFSSFSTTSTPFDTSASTSTPDASATSVPADTSATVSTPTPTDTSADIDASTPSDASTDTSTPSDDSTTTSAPTTYPNIRIEAYFGYLEETAPSSFYSYMENQVLPPLIDYFQATLKVKYPVVGNLQLDSSISNICERSTPSVLISGVPADFFIYYDSDAVSGTQIANTMYCFLASGTKRPLVARTMINRNMFSLPQGDVLLHEKNMLVIMHEMIHAFGLSHSLFIHFIDANANPLQGHLKTVNMGGMTRSVIDVPPLTDKLRSYYGCSTLEGAPLENSGGDATAASHFERQFFLYELMTSGAVLGMRISQFTLALLEGSGWYVPDYDYADPFFVGQGQGCGFLNYQCGYGGTSSFDEYCTGSNSQRGCAANGMGGGACNSDPLLGSCRAIYAFEDQYCENPDGLDDARLPSMEVYGRGSGSRCFTGTLNTRQSSNGQTTFCFKYTCNANGLATTLDVQLGSTTITCTQEGEQTLDGYYGAFNCPDPMAFCNTVGQQFCPRNCMGRGTCVNNQCQCESGYSGIDCALGPMGAN